jgi:hypothetical protein
MVFGFAGAFLMGLVLHALGTAGGAGVRERGLVRASVGLLLGGIALQTAAHLGSPGAAFVSLGIAAGVLQIGAVALFVWSVVSTAFGNGEAPRGLGGAGELVGAAVAWFALAAIANPVVFWLFETAATREDFLFRVATFNIPYGDVQLLGIATVGLVGLSVAYLPRAYGMRRPSARWRGLLFWGLNGAIAVSVATFPLGMIYRNPRMFMGQEAAALVLLAAVAALPRLFRLFGKVREGARDASLLFVRSAHVWLILAAGMLVFVPVYNLGIYAPLTGSEVPFSHAFYGAYRHALTVGYVTQMIVALSLLAVRRGARAEPGAAEGETSARPSGEGLLAASFLLLNVGNAARVSAQILTDFRPSFYLVMGATGFVEVAGLALWACCLLRRMSGPAAPGEASAPAPAGGA